MKYKMLRKFLNLMEGEMSEKYGSHYVFSCGIGWYNSLGGLAITRGVQGGISNATFILTVKDRSDIWRKKLTDHTSNADYDLIVRRVNNGKQ